MRFIVDTHVLIWALEGSKKLSKKARELLVDPDNEHWVSAASVWEIAIKSALGKLVLALPLSDLEEGIVSAGFHILDISVRHAAAVADIAIPHNDPFDRMLLAQCEVETLRLMSTDRKLANVPVVVSV